jgi:sporulation protein YlmC with PRC-barrel domain
MTLNTGASAVALLLVLGLTPPALAQTTAPSQQAPKATEAPKAPVTGQIVTQEDDTVLAKDLIGQTVYAPDKTKIGNISDLILSKDAKTVQGFVIGVGGFLGIGEKSVAMKIDRLQIAQDKDGWQLTMDAKKEELANAPSFKSKKDVDAERQAAERASNPPTGTGPRPTTKP